jgi:hypothetical protein
MAHYRSDKTCLNCGYKVDKNFCSNCGQENLEPQESFIHLVKDFYADVTHFDSKFFNSVKYLFFSPGQLTKLYAEGRRAAYIHPFRLFFFLSLVLVIVLEIPFSKKVTSLQSANEGHNRFAINFYKSLHVESLPATVEQLEYMQAQNGENINPVKHALNEHLINLKIAGEEEYLEKHHEAQLKVMPKFYIAMMPFLACFLWVVFLGTRFNFVNHLIFSFHFVAFFLFIVSIYQFLKRLVSFISVSAFSYFPSEQLSFSVIFLLSLVYLLLAVKRYYGFGWVRTILSTTIVFLMIIGLFFAAGYLVAYYCLFSI